MVVSGEYKPKKLVEIIELRDHPYFIASQFHPELRSRPGKPHPLFRELVAAACRQRGIEPMTARETRAGSETRGLTVVPPAGEAREAVS
jgi:hypothetical protein